MIYLSWCPITSGERHRLEENLHGAQIELTADDLREIQGAVSQIEVHGTRYSELRCDE